MLGTFPNGSSSLKCGHVSCAKCIKYAFELDLAAKIGAHPRRTAIPKDCLKKGVPKSKASLEALLAALFPKPKIASIPLATHQLSKCTLNQQLFLTYKCPQCQGPQDRLPELHSGLNELIAYLIEGLEKYGLTKEIDSVIPPQNYFDGLFLSLLP